jgi:small subunit ribosomal protein S1
MADNETNNSGIKRKQHFKGKVIKTTLAGAVVDIGQGRPGVVHIAHLSKSPVKRVEDVVQEGQDVDVWVRRLPKDAKHIELTMIEPLALEWREIKKGMVIEGKVVRLEKFGAFIEIGAERPGLAHISELTHGYIQTPEEAVNVGDEVKVKIIDFSRRKKQIKLSLKALLEEPKPIQEANDDEPEEDTSLTAMEVAYRKALADQDEESTDEVGGVEPDKVKSKSEQEEIIARTLKHKAKTE